MHQQFVLPFVSEFWLQIKPGLQYIIEHFIIINSLERATTRRNIMTLIARWTFAGLGGPWDETELWQSVEFPGAANTARLTHRGLELKKDGWARVRLVHVG